MTEPLDVTRLRMLREVEVRGSIAAAARALGLTPSAVSQQLAALERAAGTSLLDRSPRGVALTGAGRLLARRTVAILDQLVLARADLDRLGGLSGGPITVAAVASAAVTVVSAAAAQLRSSHPDIELRVVVAEPSVSIALLAAGDAEVAVVDEYDYVPLALPEHVNLEPLLTEPMLLLRPPGADIEPIALVDLSSTPWVLPPEDAACGAAVRAACRAAGFEPDARWVSDDLLVLVGAVAAGHGVAVLPRLAVVASSLGSPAAVATTVVCALRAPAFSRRVCTVVRTTSRARPIVGEVLSALARAAVARSTAAPELLRTTGTGLN